jgi:hypothetical protein
MRVNSALIGFFKNRLVMGAGFAILLVAILLVASSFTRHSDRDLRAKETNIIIRDIGHRLLLQSGDRTSLVLPVIETKEGTFQLRFEHKFAFDHDSLISLSQALLPKAKFPSGYTVTVHDCTKDNLVYGFQINNNTPDILACKGRSEPRGCYIIEFVFPDFYKTPVDYPFISLVCSGLLVFASLVMFIGRSGKSSALPVPNQGNYIIKESTPGLTKLGKFSFDVKAQRLLLGNEVISLTDKEWKILELLNANFGELIPRETLMEKIWLNEGVITGRSLDMFVSKLRKKLSRDPELSITNVHGKGYKLEVAAIQGS